MAEYAIRWAGTLVKELAATGTGASKLDVIRAAMKAKMDRPDLSHLPPTDPARHLSSAEAVAVLDAAVAGDPDAGVPGNPALAVTRDKARAIASTGRYVPPTPAVLPKFEDQFPPPPEDSAQMIEPTEPKRTHESTPVKNPSSESEKAGPFKPPGLAMEDQPLPPVGPKPLPTVERKGK